MASPGYAPPPLYARQWRHTTEHDVTPALDKDTAMGVGVPLTVAPRCLSGAPIFFATMATDAESKTVHVVGRAPTTRKMRV